jgi:hypothetical protein
MLHRRRTSLLFALLLLATQWLLAGHELEHGHAPDTGEAEICVLCLAGGPAALTVPIRANPPPAATARTNNTGHCGALMAPRALPPPACGPPRSS